MKIAPLAFLLLLCVWTARADDEPAVPGGKNQPGHSSHGEAFNEGPRQKAELMTGTGDVHFPVTTKNELAQKFFDQGVGQLHGFWNFEAERSFRQVAALDPDCAMAYWGMTQANSGNVKRASEFIKSAVKLKEKASRREQLWIDSLADFYSDAKKPDRDRRMAVVRALERLSYEFPDDLEAKAFLVLRIWDNEGHAIPISSKQSVDALAKQVLAANPRHPIHHYLIHLWNGEDDRRALPSAALCGEVSPAIAHMWHMPGHTFSKLHRFADAAWQQEAAARVDHAHMIASRILPEQIFNYAHNNNWLVEDLEYIGRVHDALDLAKNMIELPRPAPKQAEPGKGASYEGGSNGYTMGRDRLLETASRYELWSELTALEGTMYLAPTSDVRQETNRVTTLAIAHFAQGEKEKGEATITTLDQELQKLKTAQQTAADAAETKARNENKTEAQITAAGNDAKKKSTPRIETLQSVLAEIRVAQALALQQHEEAAALLPQAKNLSPFERVRVQLQLGQHDVAEKTAREAATRAEGQVLPLATLANVLWESGKKAEALETFKKLVPLTAQADLDTPPFARLAPLARELQLADDWRPKLAWPADAGQRPDLANLGPFRWHPYEAPGWKLADKEGQELALGDFRGKPVLVMFYLGSGCARCIEQLNFFSPVAQRFADAGISIVAVSSDSADALHETFAKAKEGQGFNFRILADPSLEAFKAYRAFDDFEKIPLHGTFLIDGSGLVRWQDISFDAFRDPEWLLVESKRLLALPVTDAPSKVATQ
jgi:peroxiredoxin